MPPERRGPRSRREPTSCRHPSLVRRGRHRVLCPPVSNLALSKLARRQIVCASTHNALLEAVPARVLSADCAPPTCTNPAQSAQAHSTQPKCDPSCTSVDPRGIRRIPARLAPRHHTPQHRHVGKLQNTFICDERSCSRPFRRAIIAAAPPPTPRAFSACACQRPRRTRAQCSRGRRGRAR